METMNQLWFFFAPILVGMGIFYAVGLLGETLLGELVELLNSFSPDDDKRWTGESWLDD